MAYNLNNLSGQEDYKRAVRAAAMETAQSLIDAQITLTEEETKATVRGYHEAEVERVGDGDYFDPIPTNEEIAEIFPGTWETAFRQYTREHAQN